MGCSLTARKEDVLRFLSNPDMPFTNNQAERDGRTMKLRQEISGGFRSNNGARDFATIRGLYLNRQKNTAGMRIALLLKSPKS